MFKKFSTVILRIKEFILNFVRMNYINIIYVLFWGAVSFIATFTCILEGDWVYIQTCDLLKGLFVPLFIWITAFFGDYIYTIIHIDKETQILDPTWTRVTYFIVEAIFILLIASVYIQNGNWRTVWMILLFLCMIGLKAASLYVVCPHKKVVRS